MARERRFLPPLLQRGGAPGELAHRRAPHLPHDERAQALQVAVPGDGPDHPTEHPGERPQDCRLGQVVFGGVLFDEPRDGFDQPLRVADIVGAERRRRGP
jgi:hypothetical protein